MINRLELLGITVATGASLALTLGLLDAPQKSSDAPQRLSGKLIQRAIPSSGEKLPVVGLAFSNHPSCADHSELTEVVKTFADNGGTFFDATLGNSTNQQFHIDAANELGVTTKLFWS